MTKRMTVTATVAVIVVVLGSQGCAVAALVLASSMAAKMGDDTKFKFHEMNVQREEAGLEPLTWEQFKLRAPTGEEETKP